MTQQAADAHDFIDSLQKGGFYVECSCGCGKNYRAKDLGLFYGHELPEEAIEAKDLFEAALKKSKASHERSLRDQHSKTKTVVFGQDFEPLVTQVSGFRYDHRDCRYFNDPIDLIVFDGLHSEGYVKEIIVSDIKTFAASLNKTQKRIVKTIGEKAVRYLQF